MIPLGEFMEKRLFLAIFLSLLVAWTFQSTFNPRPKPGEERLPQDIAAQDLKRSSADVKVSGTVSLAAPEKEAAFTEEISVLEDAGLRIELTNIGGVVRLIESKDLGHVIPVRNYAGLSSFDHKQFTVVSSGKRTITYQHIEGDWLVSREYRIEKNRTFSCQLTIKNNSQGQASLVDSMSAFIIDLSKLDNPKDPKHARSADWTLFEYALKSDKKFIRKNNIVNLNDQWNKEQDINVNWFGFRDRYFTTIAEPAFEVGKYRIKALSVDELDIGTPISLINVVPDQEFKFSFLVYAGPQRPEDLKAAKTGFEKMMVFSDWGWLNAVSMAIYWLLGTTHKIVPIWGLCIIIVSLIVYGIMYPLTLKSLTSMKKMQSLQPKIKAIQEKHKKNPEKMNQEVVELYKQHGVNPLGGCLPMLLQMPVFVGLYQVLWRSIYFRGEKFLWIKDLSMPDRLIKFPVNIPIIGDYFNILPLLMVGIMALQQHFSSKSMVITDPQQASQQKMMATMMPIMIGFMFYNFASGLNLYFVVFYLLSTATQWKLSQERAAV